jgi:hypothetical protein
MTAIKGDDDSTIRDTKVARPEDEGRTSCAEGDDSGSRGLRFKATRPEIRGFARAVD